MFSILIVEDDKNTRRLMEMVLNNDGYETHLASDGLEGLDILDQKHIDLIILDVMMPNMNGFEFTKLLRNNNMNIPILMVTAKDTIQDKREGFKTGIDDYMVKPVDEEEMLLRVNAILRRPKIANEKIISLGNIVIDYNSLSIRKDNDEIILPKKEFLLLFKLLSFPNVIFTKHQLFEEIWGLDSETTDHTVTVHINRLRSKIEDFKEFELVTIRNLGYKAVINDEK